MTRRRLLLALALATPALYLAAAPTPVDPVAWEAPAAPGYAGDFAPNTRLATLERRSLGEARGPEDVTVGPDGALYVTTADGILVERNGAFVPFARTGGRPLGLVADADGLYVADAEIGLLRVDRQGAVTRLVTHADGVPLGFTDEVDLAVDGRVYFTDASVKFPAAVYGGPLAASVLDMIEHGGHGRLLRYEPATGAVEVLLADLQFANGVVVAPDASFLLVAETGRYRILRYELTGPAAGSYRPLVENLPGFPDNLSRGADGRYYVGLVAPRDAVLDALAGWPRLRAAVARLPAALRPAPKRHGHVVVFDETGRILRSLQDTTGGYAMTTGAVEVGPHLYVTSLTEPDLGRLPLAAALAD